MIATTGKVLRDAYARPSSFITTLAVAITVILIAIILTNYSLLKFTIASGLFDTNAKIRILAANFGSFRANISILEQIIIVISAILIGMNIRVLAHYIKESLLHAGADVVDAGVMTTPMFYFCMNHLKANGGIMITASHNPAEYNGFKIFSGQNDPIAMGFGLEEFRDRALEPEEIMDVGERGTYRITSLLSEYVSFLKKKVSFSGAPMRVVVDAGGGSAALVLPELLHALGVSYTPLFFEVDGSFSRHSPNPHDRRSQAHIKKELASGEYQLGVIFDGDADRAIFFDETGEEVRPDFILALLADEALKKKKGGSFVAELTTSKAVREYIANRGGKVALCRVGRTYMRDRMKQTDSRIGAEISGHFYFKDFYYWDAAILAFLRVVELISSRGVAISALARPLAAYMSSGQVSVEVSSKEVEAYYRGQGEHSRLDGITVEFDHWWFNIRPSNTENMVRYMLEADSEKILEEKKQELEKVIARAN